MKTKYFFSCLLFIVCTLSKAQSVNTSYLCLSNGDVVLADYTNCSTTIVASHSTGLYDIAEGDTDDSLYGILSSELFFIDLITGNVNSLGFLNPVGYNGSLNLNSLVKESDGVLLAVDNNNPGPLFRINVANLTATHLGDVGFGSAGDLTFFQGNLYLSANGNQLVEIDINTPSNSTLIGTITSSSGLSNVFGVVTIITQNPCSSSPTYELIATGGSDTAILDVVTVIANVNCSNIASSTINGASEVASDVICSIDLKIEEEGTMSTNPNYCDVAVTQLNAIPDPINPIGTYSYIWTIQGSTVIIGTNATLPININTTATYFCEVTDTGRSAPDNIASDIITVTINQGSTQPTIECWETATLNSVSCTWEVTGTQPTQPTTECWQNATFNNTSCAWELIGIQPTQPTNLDCWETTTFNNTSCTWDVSGSQPTQPATECWQTATFNFTSCAWEITGTQPTQPTIDCWETATFNNTSCTWDVSGTQPNQPTTECWEIATFNNTTCSWEITGTQPIESSDVFLYICENETLTLEATTNLQNAEYNWSTNQQGPTIEIVVPGSYTVEITDGCLTEIINFTVTLEESPVITSIVSDNNDIVVYASNNSNYQYSLDGINYQTSNIFTNVQNGLYTIYVKSINCDSVEIQQHLHFYIPQFFTPNGDGINDYFTLEGLGYFNSTKVLIFNRFGKLLFNTTNSSVNWDGKLNGVDLPTSDYWYIITIDGKKYTGHFTLKR